MAIESKPFGGVKLSGDDAAAFMRQVGPIMLTPDEIDERRRQHSLAISLAIQAREARIKSASICSAHQTPDPMCNLCRTTFP